MFVRVQGEETTDDQLPEISQSWVGEPEYPFLQVADAVVPAFVVGHIAFKYSIALQTISKIEY